MSGFVGTRRARLVPLTLAAGLLLASASPGTGQSIEVGLEVTESTGGLVRQAFDSTLSARQDVEVVDRTEPADYVLSVAVLCLPDPEVCDTAGSYNVSVTLGEPLTPTQLRYGLSRTGTSVLSGWDASPEAVSYLQRYRQMHAAWATSWGRDQLSRSVARLVDGIDARCFEKRRVYERRRSGLLERGDTAAARSLPTDVVPGQDWLC